jgi:phosphotransferase system enzyme I (PtsI)
VRLDFPDVPDRTVEPDEVEHEVRRLHATVRVVTGKLRQLRDRVLERAGEEEARIFDAQILMAQDPDFLAAVEAVIRKNRFSAETAYEFKALELRQMFQNSGSAQLRDRLPDLHAIQMRMLYRLSGRRELEPWSVQTDQHVVIVAQELSPGLTVQLDRDHVVGLVSEEGTRTSHAAILAHSLGIPAVMGVAGAVSRIRNGDMLLLDGQSGAVLVDPSADELDAARTRLSRRRRFELQLETVVNQPAATPDGERVTLMAPRAWGSCAPSSCSAGAAPCHRKTSRRAISGGSRWPFRNTRSSSAAMTLGATSSRRPSRPVMRPTHSSAGARFGCASIIRSCSGTSCARSCEPRMADGSS